MTARVITLDERLDLRAAAPLAETLLASRGGDLVLDAGAVTQIGGLAVQVIRAAAQSWAGDGHQLTIAHVSPDLADQLQLLGFTPQTLARWEPRP
jgi:chemotaxis protein CheX